MSFRSLFGRALVMGLVGSGFAAAQAAPPLIPYHGRLEQAGVAATGPHQVRYGLFADPNADASCLLAVVQPDPCGLWWAQYDVEIRAGAFSALLGEEPYPLTHAVLAQNQLWLAMAVKRSSAPAYTLLAGKQRIADVPTSAVARDFTVTGTLRVGGDILNNSANGQLGASTEFVFRDTGDNWLRLNNAAGSDTYADLAVGNLYVGGGLQAGLVTVSTAGSAADCPSGTYALGGGIICNTFNGSYHSPVHSSYPVGSPATGWRGECLTQSLGSTGAGVERTYVICARLRP